MEDETFGCNYYTTPFKHHRHKYSVLHKSFFLFFTFNILISIMHVCVKWVEKWLRILRDMVF